MQWVNASPPSATGRNGTGSAGSDAQKRLRFNSQALACDQGPSTSTLLTLHHTSQLEAQPTGSLRTETDSERDKGGGTVCEGGWVWAKRKWQMWRQVDLSLWWLLGTSKGSLSINPLNILIKMYQDWKADEQKQILYCCLSSLQWSCQWGKVLLLSGAVKAPLALLCQDFKAGASYQ